MARASPLHRMHLKLGARMMEFAGWEMPLQYRGIVAEHLHTREAASLFDVSHMGQLQLVGEAAMESLERICPSDLKGLGSRRQCYSLLLNDLGGIEDDVIIGRTDSFVLAVVNASRTEHDMALIQQHLTAGVEMRHWSERALLALQGPAAAAVLEKLCPPVVDMPFMSLLELDVAGISCLVARSGYTGEDGFEISCPAADAQQLAVVLLEDDRVAPAGLGARDSLRLEAGLCLYGQELTDSITPAEARLGWVVAKNRRDPASAGFAGSKRVLEQMRHGTERLRVGLQPDGNRPVRAGALILVPDTGEAVGTVTSGGFAPSLKAPYAMGYVRSDLAVAGQVLGTEVRGHSMRLTLCPPARIRRGAD